MLSQSSPTSLDSAAFASTPRGCGRGRGLGLGVGRGLREGRGTDRYCHYCQKTNHLLEKFWLKFGKPDWANQVAYAPIVATTSHTTSTFAHEGIPSNPLGKSSFVPKHLAFIVHSSNCLSSPYPHSVWCIDSGATHTI